MIGEAEGCGHCQHRKDLEATGEQEFKELCEANKRIQFLEGQIRKMANIYIVADDFMGQMREEHLNKVADRWLTEEN